MGQSLMQFRGNPFNIFGLYEDERLVKMVMKFHLVKLLVDLLLMQEIEAIVLKLLEKTLSLKRSD